LRIQFSNLALVPVSQFPPKFRFSIKIPIFDQNSNFRSKFQFLIKISIFDQNYNHGMKSYFLGNLEANFVKRQLTFIRKTSKISNISQKFFISFHFCQKFRMTKKVQKQKSIFFVNFKGIMEFTDFRKYLMSSNPPLDWAIF